MKPGFLAGVGACALIAATAHAETPATRPLVGGHGNDIDSFVAQHDGNADRRLTWDEFETFRRQRYGETDADADGTVDIEEYVREFDARMRRQLAQDHNDKPEPARADGGSDRQARVRFGSMDTDHDGKLTFAEYQVSGKRTFDGADRNHDGVVDDADAKLPPPPKPERKTDGNAAN